jgi:hypothetical protein
MAWSIAGASQHVVVDTSADGTQAHGRVVAVAIDGAEANDPAGQHGVTRVLVHDETRTRLVWLDQTTVTAVAASRPRQKVVAATVGAAAGSGVVELINQFTSSLPHQWAVAAGPLVALIAGYLVPPGKSG